MRPLGSIQDRIRKSMVLEPEFIEGVMGSVEPVSMVKEPVSMVWEPVSMDKSCGVEPVSMV